VVDIVLRLVAGGVARFFDPMIALQSQLQQRADTSWHLAIPTRGFTAAVSVFGGTPPLKPLTCQWLLHAVAEFTRVFL
jgi:hypothetical protein